MSVWFILELYVITDCGKAQVNDMKIQAEHPFEMIQVYGGYFGTDISPVQSDVYTKPEKKAGLL